MLHVTNGDSAADRIEAAGLGGVTLPWRDVLHEGPVRDLPPEAYRDTRARFLADSLKAGYSEALATLEERDRALDAAPDEGEVVLWFEHDLYDQLQLAEVLDRLGDLDTSRTRLTLVCNAEYLGMLGVERIRERFAGRADVTGAHVSTAREGWDAFRSADPTRLEALSRAGTPALPFLAPAIRRHLEQFPSTDRGLSRSERQALEVVAAGPALMRDGFVASQEYEDPYFLGDAVFVWYVERLAAGRHPLLQLTGGEESELDARLELTESGRAVLDGRADAIALNGVDRWLGGVHLAGAEAAWRWDPARGVLVAS